MPYRFLEDVATADAAFAAWGETLEEVLVAAAEATMNVMVTDLATIAPRRELILRVTAEAEDMLLFDLLQEIIYWKDADRLLLRVGAVRLRREGGRLELEAEARGEEIDPARHELIVDVKAVTLHRFRVQPTEHGWEAQVILDI